ncbi:hypothetical protein ACP70R_030508 [Stipagrostis hirtigluma subsp. patula]
MVGSFEYAPSAMEDLLLSSDSEHSTFPSLRKPILLDTSKQMTWQFAVDEQPSSYLIRFHLRNIVSGAPQQLLDANVDSYTVVQCSPTAPGSP